MSLLGAVEELTVVIFWKRSVLRITTTLRRWILTRSSKLQLADKLSKNNSIQICKSRNRTMLEIESQKLKSIQFRSIKVASSTEWLWILTEMAELANKIVVIHPHKTNNNWHTLMCKIQILSISTSLHHAWMNRNMGTQITLSKMRVKSRTEINSTCLDSQIWTKSI